VQAGGRSLPARSSEQSAALKSCICIESPCTQTVRLGSRRSELQKPRKRSLTFRGSRTRCGSAVGQSLSRRQALQRRSATARLRKPRPGLSQNSCSKSSSVMHGLSKARRNRVCVAPTPAWAPASGLSPEGVRRRRVAEEATRDLLSERVDGLAAEGVVGGLARLHPACRRAAGGVAHWRRG